MAVDLSLVFAERKHETLAGGVCVGPLMWMQHGICCMLLLHAAVGGGGMVGMVCLDGLMWA